MLLQRQDSFPTSHLSPSSFNLTPEPDLSSSSTVSDFSDSPETSLMSAPPYPIQDFYWMSVPDFSNPQALGGHSDAYDYWQQHNTSTPRAWALNGDGDFSSHTVGQTVQGPQKFPGQHRRALSTSTATSASTSSPQQYPTNLENNYLDPYAYSAYQSHHYPTPTHTPTQDQYMDRGYNRRSRSGVSGEQAAIAQRAMKSATAGDAGQHGFAGQSAQEYLATPKTAVSDYTGGSVNGAPFGEMNSQALFDLGQDDSLFDDLALRQVPSLAPTDMSQEELYSHPLSAPPQPHNFQQQAFLNSHRGMINERLQAASDARSSNSPVSDIKRETSPFRVGSPLAPHGQMYGAMRHTGTVGTAAGQRQQQKAEADALAYHQHHAPLDESQPKTISPQEAYLDNFHEPTEDSSAPLFPQQASQQHYFDQSGQRPIYGPLNGTAQPPTSNFDFQGPPFSAASQVSASDSRFNALQHRSSGDSDHGSHDFPAHLVSMETSKSEQEPESSQEAEAEKPTGATADAGTYTCTYQNCTQRFSSPALLQKHKREGHRSTAGGSSHDAVRSPTSGRSMSPSMNTQAGPHRCDRINPSTGKPCNTVFSRPYDLTRHEDTIHARRTKVQCQYCTEEKTFSRADALTRHMRVVHPTIDFPGKHRRRNVD